MLTPPRLRSLLIKQITNSRHAEIIELEKENLDIKTEATLEREKVVEEVEGSFKYCLLVFLRLYSDTFR